MRHENEHDDSFESETDDVAGVGGVAPPTGTTANGETVLLCSRDNCAYHAGDIETLAGEEGACGRPNVSWDGDEGKCQDFLDVEELDRRDLMMARAEVEPYGAIGEWQYAIREVPVRSEIFDRCAERIEGMIDVVQVLRVNEMAPGDPVADTLMEAVQDVTARDQSIDNIVKAGKKAGPDDVILFDEKTGEAQVVPREYAEQQDRFKPPPDPAKMAEFPNMTPEEADAYLKEIGYDEQQIAMMKATFEDSKRFVESCRQAIATVMRGIQFTSDAMVEGMRRALIGKEILTGTIREISFNMEAGTIEASVEPYHSPDIITVTITPKEIKTPLLREEKTLSVIPVIAREAVVLGSRCQIIRTRSFEEVMARLMQEQVEWDYIEAWHHEVFGSLIEHLALVQRSFCKDCLWRKEEEWEASLYPMFPDRKPPCLGKRKWQAVNRACVFFNSNEIADPEEDGCLECGGHLEASDGYVQCEDCGMEWEDPFYVDPEEDLYDIPDEFPYEGKDPYTPFHPDEDDGPPEGEDC